MSSTSSIRSQYSPNIQIMDALKRRKRKRENFILDVNNYNYITITLNTLLWVVTSLLYVGVYIHVYNYMYTLYTVYTCTYTRHVNTL